MTDKMKKRIDALEYKLSKAEIRIAALEKMNAPMGTERSNAEYFDGVIPTEAEVLATGRTKRDWQVLEAIMRVRDISPNGDLLEDLRKLRENNKD